MTDDTTVPTDAEDRSDALVHAVGLYALGDVNEGKAAKVAGITRWEMRDILADAGLELRHGPQTVEGVRKDAGLTPDSAIDRPEENDQ
jgi:predicted HTH domain antitoxin